MYFIYCNSYRVGYQKKLPELLGFACRLAPQSHSCGITTEASNILLDPLKSSNLISETWKNLGSINSSCSVIPFSGMLMSITSRKVHIGIVTVVNAQTASIGGDRLCHWRLQKAKPQNCVSLTPNLCFSQQILPTNIECPFGILKRAKIRIIFCKGQIQAVVDRHHHCIRFKGLETGEGNPSHESHRFGSKF